MTPLPPRVGVGGGVGHDPASSPTYLSLAEIVLGGLCALMGITAIVVNGVLLAQVLA